MVLFYNGTWVNTDALARYLRGAVPSVVIAQLTGSRCGMLSDEEEQYAALSAICWLSNDGYNIRHIARLAHASALRGAAGHQHATDALAYVTSMDETNRDAQ